MARFWTHVKRVIRDADILIEVLDSRHVEESRNREIEDKVLESGKRLIYVINKVDMVDLDTIKIYKKLLHPCVLVSSRDKLGTTLLLKKILEVSRGKDCTVGILGYPNVGKSSLINALSGKHAASTSSRSGHTKGQQKVRLNNKIMLLDSPGVYPYKDHNETKHALISAVDYSQLKDPYEAVCKLHEEHPDFFFQWSQYADIDDILEDVAKQKNLLKKGGDIDEDRVCRYIVKVWQQG